MTTWDTTSSVKRVAAIAGLAAAALVSVGSTADAAKGTKVEGVQMPSAVPGVSTMTGDLVGDWYTTSGELGVLTPSGVVTVTGTELFVGCFDADHDGSCGGGDPTGTISFAFQYSAKFDPTTGALLHGRCHHPVTGGSGDFEQVDGGLSMHDDPSGCSYYKGHLNW